MFDVYNATLYISKASVGIQWDILKILKKMNEILCTDENKFGWPIIYIYMYVCLFLLFIARTQAH